MAICNNHHSCERLNLNVLHPNSTLFTKETELSDTEKNDSSLWGKTFEGYSCKIN